MWCTVVAALKARRRRAHIQIARAHAHTHTLAHTCACTHTGKKSSYLVVTYTFPEAVEVTAVQTDAGVDRGFTLHYTPGGPMQAYVHEATTEVRICVFDTCLCIIRKV